MLRLCVSAILWAGSTCASAEDWRLSEIQGSAPQRVAGLIDYDSVDRSDSSFPRVKQALLFETARVQGVVRVINSSVIDCAGMRSRIVHIEGQDREGKIVVSRAVEGAFDPIVAGSPADTMHLAVCDDTWLLTTETGKKPLGTIANELFGS